MEFFQVVEGRKEEKVRPSAERLARLFMSVDSIKVPTASTSKSFARCKDNFCCICYGGLSYLPCRPGSIISQQCKSSSTSKDAALSCNTKSFNQ